MRYKRLFFKQRRQGWHISKQGCICTKNALCWRFLNMQRKHIYDQTTADCKLNGNQMRARLRSYVSHKRDRQQVNARKQANKDVSRQ